MLNETDRLNEPRNERPSSTHSKPLTSAETGLRAQLRNAVSDVFLIDSETTLPADPRVSAVYSGRLLIDSEAAYAQLDDQLKPLDHFATFAKVGAQQVVSVFKGRLHPAPRPWWPNLVLFVLTILSLLFIGSLSEIKVFNRLDQILVGWPYALGVLAILGTHELGHYFAARYHKVAVTLPFFIPYPSSDGFGTLGAFIQLREPMRNRKILLDIGVSGPLAGLIVAIPVLLIGLKTSPVLVSPVIDIFTLKAHMVAYNLEGNSILYALAKIIVFGRFLPSGMHDVSINQLATAGWFGLLVTGLNLIPVGQLDGGHALYSLIGEQARRLYYPFIVVLALLATVYTYWLLWIVLLLAFGRVYATPLDMITPLNPRRRLIAVIALIVFVLVAMPIPFQEIIVGGH